MKVKHPFTLLEVMIVLTIVMFASALLGWKMHTMIANKRCKTAIERVRARLLTCHRLSLNMQSDWECRFYRDGRLWMLDTQCVDQKEAPRFSLLRCEGCEFLFNNQNGESFSLLFTASGDVAPHGELSIVFGENRLIDWKIPDLFSLRTGDRGGPARL